MNSSEQFKHYAEKVCEQIRWKKAHGIVAKEIENHLIDQKNAYMDMGDSESTAEEKALLQMGDPVTVGAALDGTHKPAPQWGMMGLVMVLFFLGLLIQYKLTTIHTVLEVKSGSIPYQLLLYGIGLAVFIGAYHLDFSFFGKHPCLLPLLLLTMDVLAQFFGTVSSGTYHWLCFGPFSISPVSLSLLFPMAFCGIFYHFRQKGSRGYFLSGLFAALCCILLLACHSVSGVAIFMASAGILMITAAFSGWFGKDVKPLLLFFVLAGIVGIGILLFSEPYRWVRIVHILHPEADPTGAGYIPTLLRGMLANAAFLGEGEPFLPYSAFLMGEALFQPENAAAYLPHLSIRTDYLLTYLAYRYGWIVFLLLAGLLSAFLFWGLRKCLQQKSVLGQIVSLAILSTFAAETLLYVIVNLGILYFAPIALPFLSYGGTALVIHMFLAGILLSVFRTGEVYQDDATPVFAGRKLLQWDDGKLIISFK